MEMLSQKNNDIKKAYDLLQIISNDQKAKILYEARQAEISDQMTRLKSAEVKGVIKVAEKMLKRGDSIEDIVDMTDLSKEIVLELKKKYQN